MRVRHENGTTIIVDVYEPEPMPRPMPRGLVAAVILAGIAVACGALAGIARFW